MSVEESRREKRSVRWLQTAFALIAALIVLAYWAMLNGVNGVFQEQTRDAVAVLCGLGVIVVIFIVGLVAAVVGGEN